MRNKILQNILIDFIKSLSTIDKKEEERENFRKLYTSATYLKR